jgi:16S rRNA (cytidine1402-2'-O)-methyltransferase
MEPQPARVKVSKARARVSFFIGLLIRRWLVNTSIVGILYIVATPIGNLQDITFRAIDVLKKANLIVAEDTRHCKVLLTHYGVQTPALSLHEHNEKAQTEGILQRLLKGSSIALISDAGTPLISDPGYRLVQEARNAGIQVVPIPGPCAAIAALSASGLPTDSFVFEGFLPMKSVARQKYLEKLSQEQRTLVFYEAPHRILEVLKDMQTVFGAERKAVIARELTKMFETIHGGKLSELVEWVEADSNQQRGEIVLMVEGVPAQEENSSGKSAEQILEILLKELPVNQAVKLACELTGEKRNKLYKQALEKK